jgi:hypothetical protein
MRSDDQFHSPSPPFIRLDAGGQSGIFEYSQKRARNFQVFEIARRVEGNQYRIGVTDDAFSASGLHCFRSSNFGEGPKRGDIVHGTLQTITYLSI